MGELEQALVERGLLTAGDLARANEVRGHGSGRLAATLVRLGLVPEADLLQAQAAATGLRIVGRSDFPETAPPIDDLEPPLPCKARNRSGRPRQWPPDAGDGRSRR